MRNWKNINSSSYTPILSEPPSPQLGYHGTTPSQGFSEEEFEKKISTCSFDCQLTIQAKVSFTRHQLCLLTGQLLREVAQEGLSLTKWILLEFFYSKLLGNKIDPLERKDSCERELSLLLEIILYLGNYLPLEGGIELPKDILLTLEESNWVPNLRTYQSRKQVYELVKYIEVRIVPLDVFLERSKSTNRYSSYCKGYGESSHMGRRLRTRPSAELDGEEIEEEKISLFDIPRLLQLVQLESKYRFRKKKA